MSILDGVACEAAGHAHGVVHKGLSKWWLPWLGIHISWTVGIYVGIADKQGPPVLVFSCCSRK